MPGSAKVPEGSGADAEVRFRKNSDAEVRSGSGGFLCTYPGQVQEGSGTEQRLGRVPEVFGADLGEVPEGSGADAEVRFRKVHTYFRLRREETFFHHVYFFCFNLVNPRMILGF